MPSIFSILSSELKGSTWTISFACFTCWMFICMSEMAQERRADSVGLPEISGQTEVGDTLTCIWFSVRVPVLSVQMVVAEPIVSQADNLRTRE
ncbi:unnamed protein product [Coffea canephora]|uniref:Uncharacterized protein n=1 Tax=Coffea canephora TaxID=49390 RepID=A0A068UP18_COFCA|nr:unnamed protein product [Coffea canephora]